METVITNTNLIINNIKQKNLREKIPEIFGVDNTKVVINLSMQYYRDMISVPLLS